MSLADRHIAALEAEIMTARQHEAAIRADERERILALGRELVERFESDQHREYGIRWFLEEIKTSTRKEDIPVRENAPQKENSVATKPPKGNTNDS